MNLLFGVASKKRKAVHFDLLHKNIEKLFQVNALLLQNSLGSIRCGYISDNGPILGKAITNDYFLVYLGALQKPLPKWDKGSPLDDPDQTANYLLSRFLEKGPRFLDDIFGQYVVVLCDIKSSKLFLGSDPGGFRKVFYCANDHQLIFGTNLVSLIRAF